MVWFNIWSIWKYYDNQIIYPNTIIYQTISRMIKYYINDILYIRKIITKPIKSLVFNIHSK